jgi:NAD(P)-dependent dehydrogenase (short-subunit alcohol dehydrogenase family)
MKTALITGATNGIGLYAARKIAEQGFRTIVHGRSQSLLDSTVEDIILTTGNDNVLSVVADFSSLDNVRSMSQEIVDNFNTLDVLINNAGATFTDRQVGIDGFELTLTINYLAPFLLTNNLIPLLRKASLDNGYSRVINVSTLGNTDDSDVADESDINWKDMQTTERYSLIKAYWRSKVLLNTFTFSLAEKELENQVHINAVHPGTIRTNMTENIASIGLIEDISKLESIDYGGQRIINLALADDDFKVTGQFFAHKQKKLKTNNPNIEARDKLWKISTELVNLQ